MADAGPGGDMSASPGADVIDLAVEGDIAPAIRPAGRAAGAVGQRIVDAAMEHAVGIEGVGADLQTGFSQIRTGGGDLDPVIERECVGWSGGVFHSRSSLLSRRG